MRFSLPEWNYGGKSMLWRLFFGSHCVICARQGHRDIDLCDDCESLLQQSQRRDSSGYLAGLCLVCGDELPGNCSEPQCAGCAGNTGPFLRIVAPYRYAFPVDHLIQAFKYRDRQVLGRVFGDLLAEAVRPGSERPGREVDAPAAEDLPTLLLPVPLFPERQRQRGYNQSAELARWCGRTLGIPSQPGWVTREYDTASLAGLSRVERQHRILGAFRADERVAGHRVAIIDDVLTTGSTARELARELHDTGVESVELWVLARTSSERVSG